LKDFTGVDTLDVDVDSHTTVPSYRMTVAARAETELLTVSLA
jgi:hypothetical protein